MSDSSTVARPADEPSPVERADKWAEKPSKLSRCFPLLALLAFLSAFSPLLVLLREPGGVPAPAQAAVEPSGLQDQVDALRQRVIVLEARADAAPRPAAAPRATAPRSGASTPAAPAPDQLAETSKFVEPPTPPAPITRQYIDQFRASLRTPQPVQE